jgi:hypothetical protein
VAHAAQPAALEPTRQITGRQVWNRQRTDQDLVDPAIVSEGDWQLAYMTPFALSAEFALGGSP